MTEREAQEAKLMCEAIDSLARLWNLKEHGAITSEQHTKMQNVLLAKLGVR